MTDYETQIRELAQKSLMMQKMIMACQAKGDANALLSQLDKLKYLADEMARISPHCRQSALVTYVNTSSFIFRTYSDMGENCTALAYGVEALHKSMLIMFPIEVYLPAELSANFKLVQLNQLIIVINELMNVKSNVAVIQKEYETIMKLLSSFNLIYSDLKIRTPQSPIIQAAAPIYEFTTNILGGEEYVKFTTSDIIIELAIGLETMLRQNALYNTDELAATDMIQYDPVFFDKWYWDCKQNLGQTSMLLVEKVLAQFYEAIDFSKLDTDTLNECFFYTADSFSWPWFIETARQILAYMYERFNLKISLSLWPQPLATSPIIQPEDIERIYRKVVKLFLYLRDNNIDVFGSLPAYPSDDELLAAAEKTQDDALRDFLFILVQMRFEIEGLYIRYACINLINRRWEVAKELLYSKHSSQISLAAYKNADPDGYQQIIEARGKYIDPFVDRLKGLKLLPQDWAYDFDRMA